VSRRVFLLVMVSVVLVLAACAPGDVSRDAAALEPAPTTTTTTTTPVTPVRTVLVLGDSVMWDAARYATGYFGAAGVQVNSQAFPGTSLLGKTDIRSTFRQVVADVRPDVVVAEYSGVYLPPFPTTPDGREILLATPEFWAAWRDAVVDATADLSSTGAKVYWVLLPHDDITWANGDTRLNDAYQAASAWFRDVRFVDWRMAVSGPYGAPVDVAPIGAFGALAPVRGPDGRHFSPEASRFLAANLVDTVLGR